MAKVKDVKIGDKTKKVVFPEVQLFSDHILTTAFTHNITASGVILQDGKGNIETRQVVVAAGPNASVEVGDEVEINPGRFPVKHTPPKHDLGPDIPHVQVPLEKIGDIVYLFMSTRELKYKYNEKSLQRK